PPYPLPGRGASTSAIRSCAGPGIRRHGATQRAPRSKVWTPQPLIAVPWPARRSRRPLPRHPPAAAPRADPSPLNQPREDNPMSAPINHIVFIIMDSCRYDSCMAASTPNIERVGQVEKRYSYASWTAPSHYAFTMGMRPHSTPREVYASEVYKEEFVQWVERTGIADVSFRDFIPELSLPKVLGQLGYRTVARVSMPVLNQQTAINQHFDDYK